MGAILDAAAAVIATDGLAGVTMHALARQACTSIGLLYHFFPDRDRVFDALFERHRIAIREITRQLDEIPASVWRHLSAAGAIDRLLSPYMDYLHHHAYLPLMQDRMRGQLPKEEHADFIRMIRRALDARLPNVEPALRQTDAVVLHAVGAGAMQVGFRMDPLRTDAYLREIPRVMAAYLADIDETEGRRSGRATGRKDRT